MVRWMVTGPFFNIFPSNVHPIKTVPGGTDKSIPYEHIPLNSNFPIYFLKLHKQIVKKVLDKRTDVR